MQKLFTVFALLLVCSACGKSATKEYNSTAPSGSMSILYLDSTGEIQQDSASFKSDSRTEMLHVSLGQPLTRDEQVLSIVGYTASKHFHLIATISKKSNPLEKGLVDLNCAPDQADCKLGTVSYTEKETTDRLGNEIPGKIFINSEGSGKNAIQSCKISINAIPLKDWTINDAGQSPFLNLWTVGSVQANISASLVCMNGNKNVLKASFVIRK